MSGPHVYDQVEAYALGALDDVERSAVDAHIAFCNECLRLVGEAEETAASLGAALPRIKPPARLGTRLRGALEPGRDAVRPRATAISLRWAPLATAAVLALAFGTTLVQNQTMRGELAQENGALTRVVHSHFLHVTMTPAAGESVSAKVLFARDGSWIYVLADQPPAGAHVVATFDGVERDLGPLVPEGTVASLFADVTKPSALELRDGTRTLATARLSY